jgi:hypothetical protein
MIDVAMVQASALAMRHTMLILLIKAPNYNILPFVLWGSLTVTDSY